MGELYSLIVTPAGREPEADATQRYQHPPLMLSSVASCMHSILTCVCLLLST